MSDTPDANDLVIAGKPLIADGEPISLDAWRAARGATSTTKKASASSGAPPEDGAPPHGDGDGPGGDGRPTIVITPEEAVVNGAAVAALAAIPNVYTRGNALVRVISAREVKGSHQDPEAPSIDMLPRPMLQEHLSRAALFVKKVPKDKHAPPDKMEWREERQHPPRWCVDAVHSRGEWPAVAGLHGVVETPILRPDGTVIGRRGYDRASETLFVGSGPIRVPSESPTTDEVKAALALLEETVCDFVFSSPAHRSTWLAGILTLLSRRAFHGPAPLFLVGAPVHRTGKGLLVDVMARIGTGRGAIVDTYSDDENEMKKSIISWGMSGRRLVMLDEVTGEFDGGALRSSLTASTIGGRVLGLSRDWSGPNTITWFATGNNVRIGEEMFGRIAPITILSPVEDPSRRSEFRHADLATYVMEHQPELTCAALTILRGYIAAGRPQAQLPAWGSFAGWSALVRQAIVWAGWPDPVQANDELKEQDTRKDAHRALVEGWDRLLGQMNRGHGVTVKEAIKWVCDSGDPAPLPELREVFDAIASDKNGKVNARLLGYVLRSVQKRWFGTARGTVAVITDGKDRTGTVRWTIQRQTQVMAGDAGDAQPPTHIPITHSNSVSGSESPASPASPSDQISFEEREEEDPFGP